MNVGIVLLQFFAQSFPKPQYFGGVTQAHTDDEKLGALRVAVGRPRLDALPVGGSVISSRRTAGGWWEHLVQFEHDLSDGRLRSANAHGDT